MKQPIDAKKIVIKIGTSSLTYENGKLNIRILDRLCRVISDLSNSGKDVILVSSGAIGVGMGKLLMKERPVLTKYKQAVAAVGQCELMFMYDKIFSDYNTTVAQVLLTNSIIKNECTKKNVINTLDTLFSMNIVPIVNENDTVSTDELEGLNLGDNDNLSSIVARLINADLLIILTDTDGLYDSNPAVNKNAKKIDRVEKITENIRIIATGSSSNRGTGGMSSKINAVASVYDYGIDCCIMNGKDPEKIYDLLNGENIGTYFNSNKNK